MKGLFHILKNQSLKDGISVLQDINFAVKKGESLAVVGRNGAGKSTLLKIISGVMKGTSGTVQVHGSIGALLELGSGFDMEYTGLENLKMASALAGITQDLDSKIERMIEFADIGDFIYEPVKTYSSGMVVRLGFAVITESRPDLLITDEILAVGDEAFQIKCLAWVEEYLANGGTLLLVSHSMYHIQTICKHAIWLEDGCVKMYGDAYKVSKAYQTEILGNLEPAAVHQDISTYHVADASLIDAGGEACREIEIKESFTLRVKLFSPDGQKPGLNLGLVSYDGRDIFGTYSSVAQVKPKAIGEKHFEFNIAFKNNPLLPGQYRFKLHAMTPDLLQTIDTYELDFYINGQTRELGVCHIDTEWH